MTKKFSLYSKPYKPNPPPKKIAQQDVIKVVKVGAWENACIEGIVAQYVEVEVDCDRDSGYEVTLAFYNKVQIDNPNYDKERKQYEKKYEQYKADLKGWNAQYKIYKADEEVKSKAWREKEFRKLKKEFEPN